MGRFHKNLNVTSKNITFFFAVAAKHSKGKGREEHLRARVKGGRGTLSSPALVPRAWSRT